MRKRRNNKSSIQSLIEKFGGLEDFLFDEDNFEDESSGGGSMPQNGREWLEAWQEVLGVFERNHSYTAQMKSQRYEPEIRVHDFVATGSVNASLAFKKKKYRMTLSFNPQQLAYDCTCSCGQQGFCEHTFLLVRHLYEQLQDQSSTLFEKVVGPDYQEQLRKEEQANMLSLMAYVAQEKVQPSIISVTKDSTKSAERFAWNFKLHYEYGETEFEVLPVQQKELKRGDGWTKGREIKLTTFLNSASENWSKIDFALADCIDVDPFDYHSDRLDYAAAFRILAGTDLVLIDRQPANLVKQDLEFILVEERNQLHLTTNAGQLREAIMNPKPATESLFLFDGGLIVIDVAQKRAVFMLASDAALKLCESLVLKNVTFSKNDKKQLMETMKSLQQAFSVRYPEGFLDEERGIENQLTLLLQLQKSGHLGITVCFKQQDGSLVFPGDGLSRETIEEKGKTIQLVRDLESERRQAQVIERELGLHQAEATEEYRYRIKDHESIFQLLTEIGELASRDQVKVIWHEASVRRFDVLGQLTANNVRVQVEKKRDWFGLNGSCRIGNQEIELKDLLAGLRGQSLNGLVEIQPGKWAAITEELKNTLQRLADVSLESRGTLKLDQSAAMTMAALEDAEIQMYADKAWKKNLARVRKAKEINIDPPAALDCDLRDYQVEGFRWMARLAEWGMGGILADDMGLGKTVQTLGMLLQRYETGPALVIAPTSLGFNWQAECERFAPSLNPLLFRESDRKELIENATEGDVIICSYGLALREAELLNSRKWGSLILDEAQNIKNGNSKTSRAIRKIKADWKIALTGTPVENHLGELWSIFQAVAPGVLGGWEQFRKRFAAPIEKNQDEERRQALARVISPFVLRRTKKAVLKDLPDRDESNLFVELTDQERKRYDQMRLAAIGELDELSTDAFSQDQRFKILQILTRLRQLSCHIGLVDKSWTGSSAKLELLMEKLNELKEGGNRPLVFSQFTSHLGLIRDACDEQGLTYQYLDGQTTPKARKERVEKFQSGEGDLFLISLKAGGTGLNLTAADYVIHMDPWWNPAVEDQATDRAHRIGQTKNVMVYRIIAKGTIEEQILKLHDEKRDLVEGVLAGAEAAGKLSTEQLAGLIRGDDPKTLQDAMK